MWSTKRAICSTCEPCYEIQSKLKQVLLCFQQFHVLTTRSGAEISRSGDFCVDDRQTKPIILSLAHAHGVIMLY